MKKLLSLVDIPISFGATVLIYYLLKGNIESVSKISACIYLFIQLLLVIVVIKMGLKKKLNPLDKMILNQQQKTARPIDTIADTEQALKDLNKNIEKGGKIMDKIKLFFDKFGSLIVSGAAVVVGLLSYSGVLDSLVEVFSPNDMARGKVVLGSVLVIAGAIVAYGGNSHTKVENASIKTVLGKEVVTKTPEQIQAEKNKKIAKVELAKVEKELKAFDVKNAKRIDVLTYNKTVAIITPDEVKELNDLLSERAYLNNRVEVNKRFAE